MHKYSALEKTELRPWSESKITWPVAMIKPCPVPWALGLAVELLLKRYRHWLSPSPLQFVIPGIQDGSPLSVRRPKTILPDALLFSGSA